MRQGKSASSVAVVLGGIGGLWCEGEEMASSELGKAGQVALVLEQTKEYAEHYPVRMTLVQH